MINEISRSYLKVLDNNSSRVLNHTSKVQYIEYQSINHVDSLLIPKIILNVIRYLIIIASKNGRKGY